MEKKVESGIVGVDFKLIHSGIASAESLDHGEDVTAYKLASIGTALLELSILPNSKTKKLVEKKLLTIFEEKYTLGLQQ